ncbi:reverse transcriptase domain-containing protein [Tanacetum coccineum]
MNTDGLKKRKEAFQQMKKLITDLPSLPPFKNKKPLSYMACRQSSKNRTSRTPKAFPEKDDTETWTLFTDGALSPKGLGAGLVLIGPSDIEYTYALRLTYPSTNNEAEYEALLAGIRIAGQMNISNIEVKVDSKLVAS